MSGRTFVGFGFGPIQSALFLLEAHLSGNFTRYVVAEIDPQLVSAVRANSGAYTVNIARADRIDPMTVSGVELYDPNVTRDRGAILSAIAEADEMATALPSVSFFDVGEHSVAKLLASGLSGRRGRKPAVIYAAENHNHAAEMLGRDVRRYAGATALENVQILNTVIGKMSGIVGEGSGPGAIRPLTPGTSSAVLVEEFNRILISRIAVPGFRRGIEVFVEKDDLLPFEEAKLYGHNAIHALVGYLADLRGLETIAQAGRCADLMQVAQRAFMDESGAALCRKYAGFGDELFTPAGYRAYAEDLLERMIRPNLNDRVARVIRDPLRKMGYDDRLFGTMRLALGQGIRPVNMARGAAAAVMGLLRHWPENCGIARPAEMNEAELGRLLGAIWGERVDEWAEEIVRLTWEGMPR